LPRFLVWATKAETSTLELVPEDGYAGKCVQWNKGDSFSLSAPIIDKTITELMDDNVWNQTKKVLEDWLKIEQKNLARFTMGVPAFSMPDSYKSNTTLTNSGIVIQSSSLPDRIPAVRDTLAEVLPWLAQAYWYQHDVRGMARVALLLRFLFPEYKWPETPNFASANYAINDALGCQGSYLFEGIDLLANRLNDMLKTGPNKPTLPE
jgi:hypothetical protein